MIQSETIEQVKAKTNIFDVVRDFVKLKKTGNEYTGLCPFHTEKTPSFKVSPGKEIYKCFGCGKSGDAISFLMEHEKLSYTDSIKWLAKKYSVEVEETNKQFKKPLPRLEKVNKKVIEYFETRGISNNTLLRFKITESKEFMQQLKQDAQVICFNYFKNSELINIKFRGPNKSFKLEKDAELIFYNLDSIQDEKEVVIVEGEIDCLSMHESGIYNSVSVPNGAVAKGTQNLQYLDNCWQYFEGKLKIILATDNDEPGKLLKEELARRLGKERCFVVNYPEDCKDANDVLIKFGKDAVKQLIQNASEYPLEGIVSINDEMIEEVLELYDNGYPKGAKLNIPGFDDLLTLAEGQLTVVTGIPNSGKSEFVDLMMIKASKHHNWIWGICSFEVPVKVHITKLAEKIIGKAFGFRKNIFSRMTRQEFEAALVFIDKYFYFINVNEIDITIEGILKKAIELVKRKGINGLLIDPWNWIEQNLPNKGMSETQYTNVVLSQILVFLKRYNVHGILVAHPTKLYKDKNTKKYEVPSLYTISGSAHFYNKSHNGISVYRHFDTNIVDVYVLKIKDYWLGKLGFTSFNFNTDTRQYLTIHEAGSNGAMNKNFMPIPTDSADVKDYKTEFEE